MVSPSRGDAGSSSSNSNSSRTASNRKKNRVCPINYYLHKRNLKQIQRKAPSNGIQLHFTYCWFMFPFIHRPWKPNPSVAFHIHFSLLCLFSFSPSLLCLNLWSFRSLSLTFCFVNIILTIYFPSYFHASRRKRKKWVLRSRRKRRRKRKKRRRRKRRIM